MTRNDACDALRVSAQTLLNYERRGHLHPRKEYRADGRGAQHLVIVYDPKELNSLSIRMNRHGVFARDNGEVAAKAYEMFDDGRPEREIVIALRITPDAVRDLHEKWLDGGGADIVISPESQSALAKLIGPFDSVAMLVDRLQTMFRPKPATATTGATGPTGPTGAMGSAAA